MKPTGLDIETVKQLAECFYSLNRFTAVKRVEKYGTQSWIEAMDSCREPSHYPHPTRPGWKVIVGAHA